MKPSDRRKFGRSGLDVTAFAFGTAPIGNFLREIDEAANNRLEQMMPELMKSAGVTEALKASDPMKWVGLMNTLKAQVEEVIQSELIWQ